MSSNIRLPRTCQYCGAGFIARTTTTKFCGEVCAKRAYKKRKREENGTTLESIPAQIPQHNHQVLKEKDFLSIAETCELLGASRMTLYRHIKSGILPAAKLGRRTIIKRSEIDKLLQP